MLLMTNKLHSWAVVLLVVLTGSLGVFADEASAALNEEISTKHLAFQWGPQVGFRIPMNGSYVASRRDGTGDYGYGIGAGLYGRMLFTPKWYLSSGFSLNYDAMTLTLNANYRQGGMADWHKYHLDSMILEVPLHAGYRFPFTDDGHFSVFLGVSGSYYLTGGLSNAPSESQKYNPFGAEGILKRASLNGDFGVTIEIEDKALVNIEGKIGMVDVAKRDIFVFQRRYYMSVTIGAVFLM